MAVSFAELSKTIQMVSLALKPMYTMQFSLQPVLQRWKEKSIASCESHVTHGNLELHLTMVSEHPCNHCRKSKPAVLCTIVTSAEELSKIQEVTLQVIDN